MEIITNSAKETEKFAVKLAKKLVRGDVIALYGDLGSGKTTFTRYLVSALGLDSRVQSPTFVIARKYQNKETLVNHLDLYRLASLSEAQDLGLEQYLEDNSAITVIEWPELIDQLLPKKTIKIEFTYLDEFKRKINVQNLH